MTALYWFALVVGGGLLLVSTLGHVLGDLFGDVGGADAPDAGAAPELHLEADAAGGSVEVADAHGGVDDVGPGAHGHMDQQGYRILSLRTATYFLFGFGATGVLLSVAWRPAHPLVTTGAAVFAGLLTGWLSATLFRWVGRGESGDLVGDRALVGTTGQVTLPLPANGTGKVTVRVGGRDLELLARPIENGDRDPASWTEVMIVEVVDGVALVSPYDVPAS